LTNIASGTAAHTKAVIAAGVGVHMIRLLSCKHMDTAEQAAWCLGNIAGDSPLARDFVLSHNVMDPLLRNLDSSKLSMLRHGTWSLSNLCRGKPQPAWEFVAPALPHLCKLLSSSDEEVLTDVCWALSYLSDGPNERIQAVAETGICRRMAELLLNSSYSVQTPALRTIGNMVTGDDSQTQIIVNFSVLPALLSLLSSPKKGIRKEACWTISNITAGNRSQIQAVIDAQIMPRLIGLLKMADFDIKKEAAWALSNATSGGSPEQIRYLVNLNIIEPFCDLLSTSDTRIVLVALEGLENILKVGDRDSKESGVNQFSGRVEACQGLDKLETLQTHQNNDIYEKVIGILENYFGAEEDQNIAPNLNTSASAFQFGMGNGTTGSFNF